MALGINTNVASLNAQNALSKSQGQNDQALQRLSSGLRINSAKDDAAGLAISTRFESQISGLAVASRNANDGISLAQTAEGALDEITNNLSRIRELAVQSANATNSASDRAALDQEVQQRIEEIDRIASQTAFNGLNVLDGSLGTQAFQVGANAGQTIDVNLEEGARSGQLGALADAELDFANGASGGGATFADGGSLGIRIGDGDTVSVAVEEGASAEDIAASIRAEDLVGVTSVTASNVQEIDFDTLTASADTAATFSIDIAVGDGTAVTVSVEVGSGGTLDAAGLATAISDRGIEGLTVSEEGGAITFETANGENFTLSNQSDVAADFGTGTGFAAADADNVTFVGQVDIQSTENVAITDDDGFVPDITGGFQLFEAEGSLDEVGVRTVADANDAIVRVDAALDAVNNIRSELGAIQNRFESTIANLASTSENLSAANSRIRDADFAAETANLSQSQVLQQAGISVLAQANARPQQVLSLLQ